MPGPGGGGVCLVWGGGGVVSGLGGGCAWSGGSASVPCGIPPPPSPVNRMTNRCKNITLATTSLRPVKHKSDTNVLQNCSGVFLNYGYYKYLK